MKRTAGQDEEGGTWEENQKQHKSYYIPIDSNQTHFLTSDYDMNNDAGFFFILFQNKTNFTSE